MMFRLLKKKSGTKAFDLIIFLLLALLVRFAYGIERFGITPGDPPEYLDIAKNLFLHHSFAFTGENGDLIFTAFRPLTYPLLIAVIDGWAEPYWNIFITQCFLGAFTVVLTYLIAHDSFGRTVAIISAFMLTFGPMSIHYGAMILTETLFTFLLTLGVFTWGREKIYLSGITFGFVALTRPIVFPFFLLLLVLHIFPEIRKKWNRHLIIILFSLIISAPWMVRNSLLFDTVVLTQSSGFGTNLIAGTIEPPLFGHDVGTRIMQNPALAGDKNLNEVEQDRLKMRIAVSRIVENPVNWIGVRIKQYPRLFMDSGYYLLGSYHVPARQALKEGNIFIISYKILFFLGHLIFYGLAVSGIYFARKKIPSLLHIFLFPIFLALIHLPMWIETRYFLPAVPLVCIISAFAIQQIILKQNLFKLKTQVSSRH